MLAEKKGGTPEEVYAIKVRKFLIWIFPLISRLKVLVISITLQLPLIFTFRF